jgi:hypothetical protein
MFVSTSKYLLLLINLIIVINSFSQSPTVGLIYSQTGVYDGYTLFTPEKNNNVYLINNCGEKINEWSFSEKPGLTCYMLENGSLLRAGVFNIQIKDWNDNLLWSYSLSNAHHDIEPLPNGNILCVLGETYNNNDVIGMGRDPFSVVGNFKLDKIVELQPVGSNSANIVWEWKFEDHLIQDFDNTKSNFGVVINHPELLDVNFHNTGDYTHVNSIDYNASLDQILMSARHTNEIYIIDHSTTTSQASSHSGGNSNMGGDILWRWGNPQVYQQGDSLDQKLHSQHDSKWVETGYLDGGKISVFNNHGDGTATFSSIHLITPQISNNAYTKTNGEFNPLNYEWSWQGSILGSLVNQFKKSSVQSLPNGNLIICETEEGRISEITKNGVHKWTYVNPSGTTVLNQFASPTNIDLFKAEKYPVSFAGFFGKDLTPKGIIENVNSISDSCALALNVRENELNEIVVINPIIDGSISFTQDVSLDKVVIIDVNGKIIYSKQNFKGNSLGVNFPASLYLLLLEYQGKIELKKIIIQ